MIGWEEIERGHRSMRGRERPEFAFASFTSPDDEKLTVVNDSEDDQLTTATANESNSSLSSHFDP